MLTQSENQLVQVGQDSLRKEFFNKKYDTFNETYLQEQLQI